MMFSSPLALTLVFLFSILQYFSCCLFVHVFVSLSSKLPQIAFCSEDHLDNYFCPSLFLSLFRGHGTYMDDENLTASVAGEVERVNKLICVRPLKTRWELDITESLRSTPWDDATLFKITQMLNLTTCTLFQIQWWSRGCDRWSDHWGLRMFKI